ncbi:hypothetical protein GCM10022259_42180 [Aquimarina mytili]
MAKNTSIKKPILQKFASDAIPIYIEVLKILAFIFFSFLKSSTFHNANNRNALDIKIGRLINEFANIPVRKAYSNIV